MDNTKSYSSLEKALEEYYVRKRITCKRKQFWEFSTTNETSQCTLKVPKCFDFKGIFHPEWHYEKDISVPGLSKWNVFLCLKRVSTHLVLKALQRSGCLKVVTNGKSPSSVLPIIMLTSMPPTLLISILFLHQLFRQWGVQTSKGLAQGNSACILKASFATLAAIASFLFVYLMFKVGFCCSRLPWGSISTVYVALWASSRICLMSERCH